MGKVADNILFKMEIMLTFFAIMYKNVHLEGLSKGYEGLGFNASL